MHQNVEVTLHVFFIIVQDKLEHGVRGCSKDSSPSAAARGPDSEDHKQP